MMTWHESCNNFDSRIEASFKDDDFNDTVFLLTQQDANDSDGEKVSANKAILALISPVFYAQFYGPLATRNDGPIEIVDGTAKGFKQLINFICNPKSFKLLVRNVAEVFDISYFAHKYQIESLVSLCRQSLGSYDVFGKAVDILNWVVCSDRGLELKETFPVEHALLVHTCWDYISWSFSSNFPNGQLKEDQYLPDEDLMIEIIKKRPQGLDEEFLLSVILDYYRKLMDKDQEVVMEQKRLKIDDESWWDEQLNKIKSVIHFDKIRPKMLAEIYEKFLGKIPDKVICDITKEISTTWKDKNIFQSSRNYDKDPLFEIPFVLINSETTGAFIHDDKVSPSEIQIKFKTSQNAILHLASTSFISCPCNENGCCLEDSESITFQNEDYREEITLQPHFFFYVTANKETTLTYETKCEESECALHLVRMNNFHLSKGNFVVDILEVNGKPVTSPCYSFIEKLMFTPI